MDSFELFMADSLGIMGTLTLLFGVLVAFGIKNRKGYIYIIFGALLIIGYAYLVLFAYKD